MKNIEKKKITLAIFIILTVIMVIILLYLNISSKNNIKKMINKIYVLHTSGNIEKDFNSQYNDNIKISKQTHIETYNPLITPSEMKPDDWNLIAEDISNNYNLYDVFVIICDYDILPYTASALSFMLEKLNKPVIFTDKQLYSTLIIASTTKIPEVMVFSNNKLFRACRIIYESSKYFKSPNYPALDLSNSLSPPQNEEKMTVKFMNNEIKVIIIRIFPGIDEKYLINSIKNKKVNGIIFELYGKGNAPTNTKFLASITDLAKKGIVMVGVPQDNTVKNSNINIRLIEAGIICGRNMTIFAAYTKLHFLLSHIENKKTIGKIMDTSLRGENN